MKMLKISMGLLLTANVAIAADKKESIERPVTPTNAPVSEVYTTPIRSSNHQPRTPPRPARHRRPFNENNENDRNAARLVSSSDLALTPTNCFSSTNNPESPFKKRRTATSFLNTSMTVISNGNDSNYVNRNLFGSNVGVSVISYSSSNHGRRDLSSDIAVISDLDTIISDLGTIISDLDTISEINSDNEYNIISDSDSDNILNRGFIYSAVGSGSGSSSDSDSESDELDSIIADSYISFLSSNSNY